MENLTFQTNKHEAILENKEFNPDNFDFSLALQKKP